MEFFTPPFLISLGNGGFLMRLAENEFRRVGMKFEVLVELSHVRSSVGLYQ
jgi:hypothetical protein